MPDIDLTSGEASMKNTPDALCNDTTQETCNQHHSKVETIPGRQVIEGIYSDASLDQNVGNEIEFGIPQSVLCGIHH